MVRSPVLSAILAFREAHGPRGALWRCVRGMFERELPEAEICVGTDDGSDPFHKTLAMNRAASGASGDVFLITDTDTWVDPTAVRIAVAAIGVDPTRWWRPWTTKLKLNEAATEHVLGLDSWDGTIDHKPFGRPENVNGFWGAPPFVLSRAMFERIGGFDERFRGWGQEDSAFAQALKVMCGPQETLSGTALHLWHPRIGKSGRDLWPGQPDAEANLRRMAVYRRARTPEQMQRVIG